MIDHHAQQRQAFIHECSEHWHYQHRQPERKTSLVDAINWLREKGRYALEVPYQVRVYTPIHGKPLECK